MPKMILKFELPEERNEMKLAIGGAKYFSLLHNIDQRLRSYQKYGKDQGQCVDDLIQSIREDIGEATFDIE